MYSTYLLISTAGIAVEAGSTVPRVIATAPKPFFSIPLVAASLVPALLNCGALATNPFLSMGSLCEVPIALVAPAVGQQ